jgi:PAS domain S-box-containing protein
MAEALLRTSLSPPALEAEYRARFLATDRRVAGLVVGCLALVSPLFLLSDARFAASRDVWVWLASFRGLQLVTELALTWIILRSRRPSTLDGAILAWTLLSALALTVQQSTRPRGYYLPVLDNVLAIMIVWTVFRTRFSVQLAGALAFTVSAVAWIALFRDPPTRPAAMLIAAILLLANGMGAFASLDSNGSRRRSFLDQRRAREAEEALRETQRTLLLSQEIARIGSYVYEAASDQWTSSPTLEAIFGIDEHRPRRGSDWLALVHPEDREAMGLYFAEVLARGSRFDRQYRVVDPRTGETRWVHGLGELQRGPGGEPIRLVGTIQDVTARRLADVESDALRLKLALASRLAAMGTLVAGVAHEINNPLAADLAGAGTALEVAREARQRLRDGEPVDARAQLRVLDTIVEALEDASEGSQRVAQIVKDLAAFANPAPRRVPLRLADVATTAIRWMPSSLAGNADVRVEIQDAPPVLASPGQIEQVVVNLLTNAVKATPAGRRGEVVVRVGPGEGGNARLDVVDRGVGIDPSIRDRIFEPFFTTRRVGLGKGAGLGLAICHAIVTDHGGSITVESEVGRGSTFRLELPAAPVADGERSPPPPAR